jgi:hypothetical protein
LSAVATRATVPARRRHVVALSYGAAGCVERALFDISDTEVFDT